MSGRWWRAYSRARHDPKLLRLTDKDFRWWFNLICVAADNGGVLPSIVNLAVEFRCNERALQISVARLQEAGLLDVTETGLKPHNWNGLQYISDVSTERVKRFRKRHETVSETPSETESDTEADTETEKKGSERASRSGSRLPDEWRPSSEDCIFAQQYDIDIDATAAVFRDYWHGVAGAKGRKADWPGTWRNWVRREVQSRQKRINGGPSAPSVALPVNRDSIEQWRTRLRGWQPGKPWLYEGAPPGEPGCRVPSQLLEEKAA